jgi:hypothetical protein
LVRISAATPAIRILEKIFVRGEEVREEKEKTAYWEHRDVTLHSTVLW